MLQSRPLGGGQVFLFLLASPFADRSSHDCQSSQDGDAHRFKSARGPFDLPTPGGGVGSVLHGHSARPLCPVFRVRGWGEPPHPVCLLVVDRPDWLVLLVGMVVALSGNRGCTHSVAVGHGNRGGVAPFAVACLCTI